MARPKSDQELTETTPYNQPFEVPAGEENDVHVLVEQIEFDGETGEKKSKPHPMTTNIRQWITFLDTHRRLGYAIVRVLHLPKDAQKFDPKEYYDEKTLGIIAKLTA